MANDSHADKNLLVHQTIVQEYEFICNKLSFLHISVKNTKPKYLQTKCIINLIVTAYLKHLYYYLP